MILNNTSKNTTLLLVWLKQLQRERARKTFLKTSKTKKVTSRMVFNGLISHEIVFPKQKDVNKI